MEPLNHEILLYTTPEGAVRVEVVFEDETFWLTQRKMAELFGVGIPTVNRHLKEIYKSLELNEIATIRRIRIVQPEGDRQVSREVDFYNLDAIIAVGYRVNSRQATQFRIWATQVLREFLVKGFVLDDERLKQGKRFGKDYFDELLERIRSIRASERRFYLKIADIYEQCSIDYNRDAEITQTFFKTVQNKLHWAITGKTAAEIVSQRADSSLPYMGLKTWKNAPHGRILKSDVTVAKNYLARRRDQVPRTHRRHVFGLCGKSGIAPDSHAHGRLGRKTGRFPQVQRVRRTHQRWQSLARGCQAACRAAL